MAEPIYPRLVGARLRGQMSYRVSFALECVAQAGGQLVELVVILVLFTRITDLGGFSVHEVLLVYALSSTAFGIADLTAGQLDELPVYLRDGTFDALLTRPLGTLPQLMVSDIRLRRLGRVASGVGVTVYALLHNDIDWTPWLLLLAVTTPLCGAVIFGSVWVAASAVSFWFVEGQEVANTVTHGGNAFAAYPITIYGLALRRVMAFALPFAFIAYYPALALLGRPDPLGGPGWLGWISPLIAVASASAAGLVWRFAVRHYRGTGS
ncbi:MULTISPECIES: ABC transporter permease [Actinosynnema]|uniref:ABC transporter permease n=1 Tax=Actinosynnema pretiosum TaxID=42197 RepID=A0A290ZE58_9PSEU|nr:ABC transporter permease [Actinosynnema pretiosum]ATE57330.1 ABC transporter permease [Actinosynnema pretiosum]